MPTPMSTMNRHDDPLRQTHQRGFTMIEVAAVLAISVFLLYALHTSLAASIKSRQLAERTHRTDNLAAEYLSRLRAIPFGQVSDPKPGAIQLSELFDDDQDLGTITLHQVAVPAGELGHTFQVASNGLVGTWRIRVSNDLDGNGSIDGEREGRADIFRIEVWFNNILQRETLLSADPAFTRQDTGKKYI